MIKKVINDKCPACKEDISYLINFNDEFASSDEYSTHITCGHCKKEFILYRKIEYVYYLQET